MLTHSIPFPGSIKNKAPLIMITLSYVITWMAAIPGYLSPLSLPFVLGMLSLPFTCEKSTRTSFRYGGVALFWLIACYFVPVRALLYFSIAFSLFFLAETNGRRLGFLSAAAVAVMSPVFQYAANVFSFPIRVQLTRWAGGLFALFMENIATAGNVITHDGQEFSVDPACMGLNMMTASLLLGIMIAGYYQKGYSRELRWGWLLLYFALIVLFNVFSNLMRILLLVQFAILPGTPLHDAAGLFCLGLYVLVPATFTARWLVKNAGREKPAAPVKAQAGKKMWVHLLLLCAVAAAGWRVASTDTYRPVRLAGMPSIAGYAASEFAPGILKLQNGRALVYIKYVRGFYDTDHQPSVCWRGSGYELQQVQESAGPHHRFYTALLVNGREQLYTAWWYGNGTVHTTDPLAWRWDMVRGGKNYAVINITAASREDLQAEVAKVLRENTFASLFRHF